MSYIGGFVGLCSHSSPKPQYVSPTLAHPYAPRCLRYGQALDDKSDKNAGTRDRGNRQTAAASGGSYNTTQPH